MFTHTPVEIPELETKTVDRKRFYLTPEGKMYPSITTVLGKRKSEGLFEWRKRVGDDVANYIARTLDCSKGYEGTPYVRRLVE